jgi:hypothetical protein
MLPTDTINAFFVKGIAHDKTITIPPTTKNGRPRKETKTGINRIYQASEIIQNFGKPESIKESNKRWDSAKLPPVMRKTSTHVFQAEHWTWKCEDGNITVAFLVAGYGTEGDAKTKRLFLSERSQIF